MLTTADGVDVSFHRRYLTLVGHIERHFPVQTWKSDDVDIWPLARMALYDDMYCADAGGYAHASRQRPFPLRAITGLATPVTNLLRSRRDLAHWVAWPKPAHAIFLGDGVSLDQVADAWRDRYAEPLIAALERRGLASVLMQAGNPRHLPWHRPTFAANVIGAWGSVAAPAKRLSAEMPQHQAVMQYLAANGVRPPSLAAASLARQARWVLATAGAFERVLRTVKPTLAFVVTYYAGLAAPFLLACRRLGILSVDLQHCPQDGGHKAYGWSAPPENGYALLPAVFWNWTERDAADIRRWTATLSSPWHRSLHGGHTQIAPFLQDTDPTTRGWDALVEGVSSGARFEREILIALQPIGGRRAQWDDLARQIKAAPAAWRWWIRRHPAALACHDAEYASLLALRMPNVNLQHASSLPLPALLRHMSALLSLASGAAAEAAAFGVPALFLSELARGPFADLIERGAASVVATRDLIQVIADLPPKAARPAAIHLPDLDATLQNLEAIAPDYSALCRAAGRRTS